MMEDRVGVSIGTAAALGLAKAALDVAPTTAYLLTGRRCRYQCAFCPQAGDASPHGNGRLARVSWPRYPLELVARCLKERTHSFRRICLQVVQESGWLETSCRIIRVLREVLGENLPPVSVSCRPEGLEEVAYLLKAGADRVGIPLDAATPALFREIRGGCWSDLYDLLMIAACCFPLDISTHIIMGLGETEEDILRLARELNKAGVTIGLFAFTPVPGTRMPGGTQPALQSYRRVQVGIYLIRLGLADGDSFKYENGVLVDCGFSPEELAGLPGIADAFRTGGCVDCNRPFYNERPGGPMYNYPRPLTGEEVRACLQAAFGG